MLGDEVLEDIRVRVAHGFDNRESVFESILGNYPHELGITKEQYGAADLEPATAAALCDAIEHAFAERKQEMESWPERTDCDRLRDAFDALEEQSIIALENPGFTQQLGVSRARDLAIARDELGGPPVRGYCFFSSQDVAHAIEGGGLLLAYGPFTEDSSPPDVVVPPRQRCTACGGRGWIAPTDPTQFPTTCTRCLGAAPAKLEPVPTSCQKIGRSVVEACRRFGLLVEWNGDSSTRVRLPNFRWQRRLIQSQESDVRDFLESWELEIRAGYTPTNEIVERLEERARDWFDTFSDFGPVLRDRLRAHTVRLLDEERRREASWSDATMNDRITRAFAELNARRILAREDLGLTIQDGWVYAGLEAESDTRGVVFFHHEDVLDGVDGKGLLLAFGALGVKPSDDAEAGVTLAREVQSVLAEHGVSTSWSESLSERIRIAPFEWRKRRWTTTPEYERSSPTPPASKRPSLLAKLFGGGKTTAPASPEQQSTEFSTARRAAVVAKALRDENGFNVPRSRRLRAAWKALGNHGEAQVGHLGSPHCFVRAESFTSMMPQLAITNLRDEKADLLRRAEKAKAAKPGPSPAT